MVPLTALCQQICNYSNVNFRIAHIVRIVQTCNTCTAKTLHIKCQTKLFTTNNQCTPIYHWHATPHKRHDAYLVVSFSCIHSTQPPHHIMHIHTHLLSICANFPINTHHTHHCLFTCSRAIQTMARGPCFNWHQKDTIKQHSFDKKKSVRVGVNINCGMNVCVHIICVCVCLFMCMSECTKSMCGYLADTVNCIYVPLCEILQMRTCHKVCILTFLESIQSICT